MHPSLSRPQPRPDQCRSNKKYLLFFHLHYRPHTAQVCRRTIREAPPSALLQCRSTLCSRVGRHPGQSDRGSQHTAPGVYPTRRKSSIRNLGSRASRRCREGGTEIAGSFHTKLLAAFIDDPRLLELAGKYASEFELSAVASYIRQLNMPRLTLASSIATLQTGAARQPRAPAIRDIFWSRAQGKRATATSAARQARRSWAATA